MDDRTAARFEISELISRYGNLLDAGDFDGLETLFAPDASFTIVPDDGVPPLVGARAIREAIEARWSLVHRDAQRRHVMSNIVVDLVGAQTASARTVLVVYEVGKQPGSAIVVHGMGVYDDALVLVDGSWRFAERRLTLDRTDYFAPGWDSVE